MDQQGQYNEALCLLHIELKETKEKLEVADRQKETLQEELTASRQWVEKAEADAVQEFKALQSFIDSCADYYGIGFNDCLKQMKFAFLDLDL